MQDSLDITIYCDHGHPDIKAAAVGLRAYEGDPVAIARRTFYFVRDTIPFGFDLYLRSASETLQRGFGACWNKSLLLTALLRCNQIPAQFGAIPLQRNFIKPAIGYWYRLANNPFNHCLVRAHLNGHWIILDAVLDKRTYETFYAPLGVSWNIDWQGTTSVQLYTESVLGPPKFYRDIDATLQGRVGNFELPKHLAVLGNIWVNRQLFNKKGNSLVNGIY